MLSKPDAYLSDDTEGRLRQAIGEPCKSCQHLIVRQSTIIEGTLRDCKAALGNEVLGRVLIRLAETGRCDEAIPFTANEFNDEAVAPHETATPGPEVTQHQNAVIAQFVSCVTRNL